MAKRVDHINENQLVNLFTNHPYLLVFRKEDWSDYILLLTHIYDLLEQEHTRTPYEVIKNIAINYYSQKQLQQVEAKVSQFLVMSITELGVLKDSHDQWGQRYIEVTRSGKALLQLIESLLLQRVKFSGTGAETLLSALNNILRSQQQMTQEQAIEHHKDKIKAYQKDLQKIKDLGIAHAELLPIPHSNEALFSQADESASDILEAMEDVKTAIENYRKTLADNYFNQEESLGQRLNTTVDFYQNLHLSREYESYQEAKNLLSFLEGLTERFPSKNIDLMIKKISDLELIEKESVERSHLKRFTSLFQSSDLSIQEKIRSQIKVLQHQVQYSLSGSALGVNQILKDIFTDLVKNKTCVSSFFEHTPYIAKIPTDLDLKAYQSYSFPVPQEEVSSFLESSFITEEEARALIEMLLRAEETTVNQILERLENELANKKSFTLLEYEFKYGLAEYYVLQELEIFAPHIHKHFLHHEDLKIQTKTDELFIYQSPIHRYQIQPNGEPL